MPFEFDIPRKERSIIKVIGVGGGGGNAVSHMFRQGIVGVDFAICNTDSQSMESSPVNTKIQLGPQLTEGRGAGSRPSVGKQACIESIEDVRRFLEEGTKMLFITAGMGGGTGTGAAPIIAEAAMDLGILTVGIVTIPFSFEGRRRISHATEGIEDLKKHVDALIVISNDKLREIHGNLSISDAFGKADNILTTAAKGIAEIITLPGNVNVDFEDVNTVMRQSGVAIMGTAVADGEDRAKQAVMSALSSPLLEDDEIRGANHILLNITSGAKEITMDEIFEITNYVQEEAGYGTNLIWGHCFDESLAESLCVTVIATGFEEKKSLAREVATSEKIFVSLDENETRKDVEPDLFEVDLSDDEQTNTIEFKDVESSVDHSNRTQSGPYADPYVKSADRERAQRERELRHQRLMEKKEQQRKKLAKLSKDTIHELEQEPAYKRKMVQLDDIPAAGDFGYSKWTITDDDHPSVRQENSFLHDNVD
jgi:cell division protein FtsZ